MIAAGIVTYEPDLDRLADNLSGIAPQVEFALVYDNGSSNAAAINNLVAQFHNVDLVRNLENRGVAFALNELARGAAARGAAAIVTLDQDSVCPSGMVQELKRVMLQHDYRQSSGVGIVAPYVVDRNKLTVQQFQAMHLPEVEPYRQPARRGAITSGSLVKLEVWKEVGGYDDTFFIDYVDYDFNQRVLRAGYRILRANRTHLLHEVGKARRTWLRVPRRDVSGRWRIEPFYSFGHSPQRCYYKARNRVLFTRKHGRDLGITHEGVWQIPQQIALTLLFEDDRVAKLAAFLRGVRDGLRLQLRIPKKTGGPRQARRQAKG